MTIVGGPVASRTCSHRRRHREPRVQFVSRYPDVTGGTARRRKTTRRGGDGGGREDTSAPTLITLWDCIFFFFFRSMPSQRCADDDDAAVSVRGLSSRSAARVFQCLSSRSSRARHHGYDCDNNNDITVVVTISNATGGETTVWPAVVPTS
ncbi:Hypothetical protein CINCED_3A020399 [Cinara cedri]|uniref:Uncharacterized protein n=1 Tax=Cinara cedri TaxID=506608 RepID=A0A5E4N5T4_9HEMI|nr:Hypothetical protein CINCED_3A020399 [Cinara cedri]